MDITRWSTPKSDWLYSLQPKMEKLYTVNKNKTRSWLWLRSWILIAKFRLKLKKVGKTTRPFTYDLNQWPYDYTVEVRNRFKGLDLIDRVPDELWTEVHDIVQETGIKPRSPALQTDALPSEPPGKPRILIRNIELVLKGDLKEEMIR